MSVQKLPQKLTRQQQAAKLADTKTRLAELDTDLASRRSQKTSATIVFIVGLLLAPVGIGIVVVIYALVRYFAHKGAIRELEEERATLVAKINRMEAVLLAG
jgi:uncharacterized membrane protein YidH (DUF202 family)